MIQTTEVSITYKGDGVQTSFPYPYPYRNSDDIVGYIINDVGYEKRITNNFKYDKVNNIYQYPLAGDPLAAPYSIKLIRETPQQQNADLPGKLPFSLIEKSLDWIIMILQEIGSRCNSLWHIRNDCKLSETNARNSASAAAESEENAANSEDMAKKWAMSPVSPDGVVDTDSPTGYTQSAKIWAALSKEYAGLSKFKLPIGYYTSVAEMKASDTAIVGRPCVTLGYYAANDGGGAVYIVRSKTDSDTDDGGSIIVMDNGNVAELIADGAVNVRQFGAKGDGTTDDTAAIQHALDKSDNVIVPAGTYLVNAVTNLKLTDRKNMHITIMAGAEIKAITTDASHYYVFALLRCNNVVIDGGGTITGDTDTHTGTDGEWGYGIQIYHCTNIVVKDLEIQKMWGDGVYIGDYIDGQQCENIIVRDCYLHNNRRQGISICYAKSVLVDNCLITNISGAAPQSGIDIELEGNASTLVAQSDIRIKNTKITKCAGPSIQIYGDATGIVIDNCLADGNLDLIKNSAGAVEVYNSKLKELKISSATDPGTIIHNCSINTISFKNTLYAYDCTINLINLLGVCYMMGGSLLTLYKDDTTTGKFYANGIRLGDGKGTINLNSNADFVLKNSTIMALEWNLWQLTFGVGVIDNCDIIYNTFYLSTYNELVITNSKLTFVVKNTSECIINLASTTGKTILKNNIFNFDEATGNSNNSAMVLLNNDATIMNNLIRIKNKIAPPFSINTSQAVVSGNVCTDAVQMIVRKSGSKIYGTGNVTSQSILQ